VSGIGTGNPDVVLNPALKDERRACHKCAVYEQCMFTNAKMGRLKGNARYETQGRHNVAYQLRTDRSEEYSAKVDFVACDVFSQDLRDRMLTGRNLRELGKDGEIVRICGHEGDMIKQSHIVTFNGRGEVTNAMPELKEPLRRAGYTVNETDQTITGRKEIRLERAVPKWTPPTRQHSGIGQEIMDDIARDMEEEEGAIEAAIERRAARRADDAEFEPVVKDDAPVLARKVE
jgi:hypothetical protein